MRAAANACRDGRIQAGIVCVISNNSDSGALRFARAQGIPAFHLSARTHPVTDDLDQQMLRVLRDHDAEIIVLAGYMKKLPPKTFAEFRGQVLNIHPALLPKYGGRGMYGLAVHEAVLASGDKETGVTIHLVDEEYDRGPILAQTRIPVLESDTAESLRFRVLEREHEFLVETLSAFTLRGHD